MKPQANGARLTLSRVRSSIATMLCLNKHLTKTPAGKALDKRIKAANKARFKAAANGVSKGKGGRCS